MTLDVLSYNWTSQCWDLEMRIWESDGDVTATAGNFTIILRDDHNVEAFRATRSLKETDFTMTETRQPSSRVVLIDYFYRLSIPVKDVAGGPPSKSVPAGWGWDGEVWFTYEDTTIRSVPRWVEPVAVYASGAERSVDGSLYNVRLVLVSDQNRTTKWSGTFDLTLTDGNGALLYEGGQWVDAAMFRFEGDSSQASSYRRNVTAFTSLDVPVSEIGTSEDVDGDHRATMVLGVSFSWADRALRQDAGPGPYGAPLAIEVPEHLLIPPPGALPVPIISGPSTCFKGEQVEFGADGSFDRDGMITRYAWAFQDGTTQVFGVQTNFLHTFQQQGSWNVTLTLTDDVGWTNSTTSTVTVVYPISFELLEMTQITEPGDMENTTILRVRLRNIAPWYVPREGSAAWTAYTADSTAIPVSKAEGEVPVSLGPNETAEFVLYYQYIPQGSDAPLLFTPVGLLVWGTWEVELDAG